MELKNCSEQGPQAGLGSYLREPPVQDVPRTGEQPTSSMNRPRSMKARSCQG